MRPAGLAALLLVATLVAAPTTAGKPTKHAAAAVELSELVVHSAEFNGTLQEGSSNGVYASIENTGAPTASAFTVRFDIDGSWTSDVQMPPGFVGYGSPNAPERWTATVGTHILTVTVDADNQVPEADETNNVLKQAFEVQPGPPSPPDLRIQNGGFVDPVDQEGQSSRAWVVVENAGSSTQADSLISFEVDGSSLGYATIPAGYAGTQAFQSPQAWTATAGTHGLRIVADAGQAIAESDEQNNVFTTAVTVQGGSGGTSELRVQYATMNGTAREGVPIDAYASLENTGEPTPVDVRVSFYVDANSLGEGTVPAGWTGIVAVGSPQQWTPTAGWHRLRVVVDVGYAIQESNEDDNAYDADFYVDPSTGRPDLLVPSAAFRSSTNEGEWSDVAAQVENTGPATTADFVVSFYVDTMTLGTVTISSGFTGTVTVVSPQGWVAREGNHTLRVLADEPNTVQETDDLNNEFRRDFTVADVSDTDLMVSETQFNGSFVSGHTGRFGAYVQNWNDPTPADALVRFEVDGQWLGDAVVPAGFQGVRLFEAPQEWTATAGNHVMVATVDPDGRIAEPREDNNAFSWSFWVQYDVTPPPARETLFTWYSFSNETAGVESATIYVPSDYTGVWWDLHCTTSTVEAYLDGALMATCVQGVRTLLNPDYLTAGQHIFRVVYAGLDSASVQVTGVPVR